MTETQAKSGGSGTSATPVDEEPKKNGTEPAGREADGRDAAGRAAVPADGSSSAPKFTRAPGMAPPPSDPAGGKDGSSPEPKRPAPPVGAAKGSASVPIVTKGKSTPPSGTPQGRPSVMPPQRHGTPATGP